MALSDLCRLMSFYVDLCRCLQTYVDLCRCPEKKVLSLQTENQRNNFARKTIEFILSLGLVTYIQERYTIQLITLIRTGTHADLFDK